MNITHTFTIEKLQTEFEQIIQIYEEIQDQRIEIQKKLMQLKDIYNDLVKNNSKKIFLFCLDAFYFQYKVLNIELDNLNRFLSLINNRMYGDYYKLYNIMITKSAQYICSDCSATDVCIDINKIVSPYNDVEPFHEYPISDTQSIHKDIITIINQIFVFYTKKETEIMNYNLNKIGISIDSFINTLEYNNNLIQEQLQLYVNYTSFFHKTQIEYLSKLVNKIYAFHSEIDEDLISNNMNIDLDHDEIVDCVIFTINDL